MKWLFNSKLLRYAVGQSPVLQVDGIAIGKPDDLGKLSPGRRMVRSVEVGLQKCKVFFVDAFLLKGLKRLEVISCGSEFIVTSGHVRGAFEDGKKYWGKRR
jgi:hypothetical protein